MRLRPPRGARVRRRRRRKGGPHARARLRPGVLSAAVVMLRQPVVGPADPTPTRSAAAMRMAGRATAGASRAPGG